MATRPLESLLRPTTHRLLPLTPAQAVDIARWPRSNGEAFWLAPRTPPPITGEKILNWAAPGRQQLVLCESDTVITPVPYAAADDSAREFVGVRSARARELSGPSATWNAVGYGELNVLNVEIAEYWIGHLIVNPAHRGQGLGTILTRLLVQRAFTTLAARRISLVVFPENKAAVRCYEQVGFRREGSETHYFPIYMRRAHLIRMAIHA